MLSTMAFDAGLKVLFGIVTFVLFIQEGCCLSCPSGWTQRQGTYDCYDFRTDTTSWDQARAYCHNNEADLTSLDKAGENEWVISQLGGSSFTDDYWIGLSDPFGHLVYVWSDGSIYDPNLANWARDRPSHSDGTKACVAMGVNQRWAWIDEDCGSNKAYVCHKTLTQPVRCDESNGWTEKFQNCYYTSTRWMSFDDAQEYCTRFDANLMDVVDADEQMFLSELVQEAQNSIWIGYKTISGKDDFKWTSGHANGFVKWGTNEPNVDTPEKCTLVTYAGISTGNWSTADCFTSRRFICEKPTGMCYPGWRIHDGYCYQMVAYSPTTWVGAKQQCEAQGSTLLTVKSDKEQQFIDEQLPVLWQTGITNIWLGISDTITDGEMKWADGTAYDDTAFQNWPAHKTPVNKEDESQCGSIYAGSTIGQWDYGDCFNLFDYACKLREGAPITPVDPNKPTGYCPSDWYFYNNFCYYVDEDGFTYTQAKQTCNEKGGKLASIHSAEEMSFIELHLQENDYYIGLERSGTGASSFRWSDSTQFDYHNWDIGEPNNSGQQEDCVHVRGPYITPSGVWNDISCDRKYASICKKTAEQTTPPPPTNPPNVGCYEPFQPYKGISILTVDGDVCYNWQDANREYNPIDYPNKDLTENYCRNPNNAEKPWCYVEFGFKDCDVPQCQAPVDCYEGDGYLYRGKTSKTDSGTNCLSWASLDNSAYYRPDTFPEEGLEGNYCRNPGGSTTGPWCYYEKGTFGYYSANCGIPQCNTTGCYEGNGANYRGTASEGENGKTCEKWDDATDEPYNPVAFPKAGLDHNYCRNPSQDTEPWCYVLDGRQQLTQEPCIVPHCATEVGCYVGKGMAYRGHANYVTMGRTCSHWVDFINEFYPIPRNEFSMQSNKAIRPVSKSFNGLSLDTCAYKCLNHQAFFCKSFNYYQGTDDGDSRCLLTTVNSADVEPISDPQQDYYERNQTYGLEENYCRNPNNAMAPWCYFYDPIHNETDWSYCGVPECNPEDVGCYDPTARGKTYRGAARTTASGHVCVEWTDTFYTPQRFPNSGLDENYCRNPSSFRNSPFCYYQGTHGLMSEECDIPQCDVKVICDGEGWRADPSEEWCYKIDTDSYLSFDQAQEACERESGNLLSILSQAESNLIVGMIADVEVNGFWIGANDRFHEAGWEWTDGSPFSYLHWQPGQPDNMNGIEQCVFMASGNGMWTDEQCDLMFPHICKKRSLTSIGSSAAPTTLAPGSRCPVDWEGYGSHCYLVQKDFVGWSKALSSCTALDATLAAVHSEGEMTHIASMTSKESRQYYFFGANDIQKHGTWTYGNGTNDTPLPYLKWAEGQPDNMGGNGEDCVSMKYQYNWQWNDEVCEKKFQVVCEYENNGGDANFGRYSAHVDTMTYADAQAHCVKYDGSMATINNDNDQADMVTLLNSIYDPFQSDVFWLGVNDIKKEGSWIAGGDPDGTTTQTYFQWREGEPNNQIVPGEHCGLMAPVDESDPENFKFEWYDWSCDNDERFICEDIDPDSTHIGSGNHPYTVVNEAMSWALAASYCKSKGGRLAQVRTSWDQLNAINYMLSANRQKLLSSKGAWLGLNDISHQMTFEWADGSEVTYTNWNAGEPDDFTHTQDCVFAYSQSGKDSTGMKYYAGKWADYDCEAEDFGYVCQKGKGSFGPSEIPPPEYDCPLGWTGSDIYCYKLLEGQMTWDEALQTCADNMDHGKPTNTTLAYIPDYKEQNILTEALLETTGLYWIGLHGSGNTGVQYEWATGQPVTFTNWDEQQPGNNQHPCIAMSAGETNYGQWDDQDCESRYSAICQKPRREGVVPELPPTPSPTGTCPAGWAAFESNCYLVVRQTNETIRQDWIDAYDDCFMRTYNFATDLASFHSYEEEQFIAGLVKGMTPSVDPAEEFWIGMSVSSTYDYYWWDDSSPLQYVHWGLNMPDGRPDVDFSALVTYPGAIDSGWKFIDGNSKRSWICKTPRDTYMMTTLPNISPSLSEKCGDNWQNWTYNANLDTCYKFMGLMEQDRAIWSGGHAGCRGQNAELVSIHSPAENKFVQDLTNRNSFDAIWTGMYDTQNRGGFVWSDGSPAEYFKWDAHEPGNDVTSCIKLDAVTGGWRVTECDTQMAYVCKRTPGGHNYTPAPTEQAGGFCPKNWFTWGNKCLRFLDSYDSWTNHRNACQAHGGDLASIRDRTDQAYIVTLLESVPDTVWIGLNDRNSEGLFSWSDGTPVYFTNWDTNEPNDYNDNEDCINMFGSNSGRNPGTWNDAECTQRYRGLCQIPRDAQGTPVAPTLSLCGSYRHYANACYKIYNGSYKRDQAKTMCESDGLGSTLASINSIYEDYEISLMMREAGIDSPMYIGLTYANNSYSWDDTWPVMYTRWASGQPSLGDDEKCVVVNSDVQGSGTWDDVPCGSRYGAVCKYSNGIPPVQPTLSPEDCPGPDWAVHESACYKAYLDEEFLVPWSAALYVCKEDRASLASIHNAREQAFVASLASGDIYAVWIGLNNIGQFGFSWEDESPVEYLSWAPGEPSGTNGDQQDEQCTEMYTNGGHIGKWNDLYCLGKLPFVCKYTTGGPIYRTTQETGPEPISGGGLGVGAIVGISVGAVVFIVVVAGLVVTLRRRNRMVAYFRSVAGLEVAPEQLFNDESSRGGRADSFDDAMLSVNS